MRRYFYDFEFNEDGKTIEPISLGVVCSDGREFYAVSTDFDRNRCNEWVKDNVLPNLHATISHKSQFMTRATLAQQLRYFISAHDDRFGKCINCGRAPKSHHRLLADLHTEYMSVSEGRLGLACRKMPPFELWGYYSAYDHVALAQLFGRMIDLPAGWPMFTHDVRQFMDHVGIRREDLPAEPDQKHNALADARWNREAWLACSKRQRESR